MQNLGPFPDQLSQNLHFSKRVMHFHLLGFIWLHFRVGRTGLWNWQRAGKEMALGASTLGWKVWSLWRQRRPWDLLGSISNVGREVQNCIYTHIKYMSHPTHTNYPDVVLSLLLLWRYIYFITTQPKTPHLLYSIKIKTKLIRSWSLGGIVKRETTSSFINSVVCKHAWNVFGVTYHPEEGSAVNI